MWYPNFAEFVKNNEISTNIDKIYFSLGNNVNFDIKNKLIENFRLFLAKIFNEYNIKNARRKIIWYFLYSSKYFTISYTP